MNRRRRWILVGSSALALALGLIVALQTDPGWAFAERAWQRLRGRYTVAEQVERHGPAVQARLAPRFAAAGLAYPPRELVILAFKDTRVLELYGRDPATNSWRRVTSYPIRGMSGTLGPKLREGDRQVPEGLYAAEALNPNSRFHLAIRLDYPNRFDRARGAADGRTQLGSDIMIHGTSASVGCLAMGNEAAEDLFVVVALAGPQNVRILVAPTDLRDGRPAPEVAGPAWIPELYQQLRRALHEFPITPAGGGALIAPG